MFKYFKNGKSVNYYDYKEVDELISKLTDLKYDCIQLDEGVLGSGTWICVAPEGYYNYSITEVALNSWTSGHIVRKRKTLTKKDKEILKEHGYTYEEESMWKEEIYNLFRDFCLPLKKAREIIKDVDRRYADMDDDYKYNKAWRIFISMI